MKKIIIILCVALFFGACKNSNIEKVVEEKTVEKETPAEEESSLIESTEAQMKAVGITTDTLEYKDLTATVKVNGVLAVPNQNKALVTSVTNGVVRTLNVQPGDFVNKGQVVATIINPDVAPLQQQLQITNAQISMALIEQSRQQELVAGNAAPLKNLQRVNTELATLRATKNGLQQQLRTMGISYSSGAINTTLRVLAPISGTVSEVTAQIGSNVDAATPIAHIVNNSQLHLDIFVYEKDLPKIKEKQTIHFTLTNLQGKEYDAEIYSIGAAFANDSKTVPVHAVVKGDKTGLIDGMNITAIISTGTATVPAVPSEAIITNAGQDYIFIVSQQTKKETKNKEASKEEPSILFEKIPVSKGTSDVGFTEIIPVTPLPPNARIVTKGAFFVLAKMTNKGEEE
jgi:cobalt-zinc-cadmium efflux system membrane fusion protein